MTSDLIARLRDAEGPSRELDAQIAVARGWKAWRSKHGYWNFDGPNGEHVNTYGDPRPVRFDPDTGKKNPHYDEIPWWRLAELANVPEYTSSLDAATGLFADEATAVRAIWGAAQRASSGRLPSKFDLIREVVERALEAIQKEKG